MMRRDRWGVAIAAPTHAPLEPFDDAVRSLCLMRGQPSAVLDDLSREDGTWALVEIFRAYLDLYAQTTDGNELAVERLVTLGDATSSWGERERAHHAAALRWSVGDLDGALALLGGWILIEPHDLLALRVAQDLAFFLGDQEALLALPDGARAAWSLDVRERGLVLGMTAFGFEEQGQFREAEELARTALAIDPTDAWSTHALAHVMEMEGRSQEGADFLRSSTSSWSPSFFASHNWWHLALFLLELDDTDGAIELLLGPISAPGSTVWFEIVNQASLLWRLALVDADPGPPSPELLGVLTERSDQTLSVFNALHAVAALSLGGRTDAVESIIRSYRSKEAHGIETLLLEGFAEFGAARFEPAARSLTAARSGATAIGGSNAQRDLIDQTLLLATVRSNGPLSVIDDLIASHPQRWSAATTARLTRRQPSSP
jgi:tetratricopeptide (TPR) repeat protein